MMKKIVSLIVLVGCVLVLACGGGSEPAPAASAPAAEAPAAAPASGGMEADGTATITGMIKYEGEVPTLRPISLSADPGCESKHSEPFLPEVLVVGEGNSLGNVLVTVKSGLPAGQWKVPSTPVTMDQHGCRYIPHVASVMVGQTFKILNSDGLLHNVHALPKDNQEFNMAMPGSRTEADKTFDKAEPTPFRIKCDVHPWMGAFVAVLSHPFSAVTKTDGQFSISGLPAGTYEIEAWHERLGTQTATVTVADGETKAADFTFTR